MLHQETPSGVGIAEANVTYKYLKRIVLKYLSDIFHSKYYRRMSVINRDSNHWRLDCLVNCLFRRRLNKTSKLHFTDLCVGNPSVTGGFPSQRPNNAENVPIWKRHRDLRFPFMVLCDLRFSIEKGQLGIRRFHVMAATWYPLVIYINRHG